MNNLTKEILSNYDCKQKIKYLDLSNKNISGILDLEKFKYLEELNCSNNKITNILNLSTTIKYINCSHNKIKSLLNLPNSLIGINCKYNPIEELYYPFTVKPKKYPSRLKKLILRN